MMMKTNIYKVLATYLEISELIYIHYFHLSLLAILAQFIEEETDTERLLKLSKVTQISSGSCRI